MTLLVVNQRREGLAPNAVSAAKQGERRSSWLMQPTAHPRHSAFHGVAAPAATASGDAHCDAHCGDGVLPGSVQHTTVGGVAASLGATPPCGEFFSAPLTQQSDGSNPAFAVQRMQRMQSLNVQDMERKPYRETLHTQTSTVEEPCGAHGMQPSEALRFPFVQAIGPATVPLPTSAHLPSPSDTASATAMAQQCCFQQPLPAWRGRGSGPVPTPFGSGAAPLRDQQAGQVHCGVHPCTTQGSLSSSHRQPWGQHVHCSAPQAPPGVSQASLPSAPDRTFTGLPSPPMQQGPSADHLFPEYREVPPLRQASNGTETKAPSRPTRDAPTLRTPTDILAQLKTEVRYVPICVPVLLRTKCTYQRCVMVCFRRNSMLSLMDSNLARSNAARMS
jgi:hypothetical protein